MTTFTDDTPVITNIECSLVRSCVGTGHKHPSQHMAGATAAEDAIPATAALAAVAAAAASVADGGSGSAFKPLSYFTGDKVKLKKVVRDLLLQYQARGKDGAATGEC